MNNQDWDDYCWQREGTAYGDMAKDHNDAILGRGKYAKDNKPYVANTGPRRPRQPLAGEATLSNLCSSIDNGIKALIHTVSWKIWLAIGVVCAIPLGVIANQNQYTPLGIGIAALFGLFLPLIIVHSIRIAVIIVTTIMGYCLIYTYLLVKVAIVLAIIAGVLYGLVLAMG